jgi:peptidoglycan/xylan/chitin deacetylase (PgdA/CDA1 family)
MTVSPRPLIEHGATSTGGTAPHAVPPAAQGPGGPPLTVRVKRRILRASSNVGLLHRIRDSAWRSRRLLILCYHSIAIDDEHEWSGTYSMSADRLAARFRMLRDGGYSVLPLDEAVRRLYDGTLPPRSVTLTFDDGMYDFRARALPLLREFGFPATVYLTTYHSDNNEPIFGLYCSYLLWRARARTPEPDTQTLLGRRSAWTLATARGRARAHRELLDHAAREGLTVPERTALAAKLADVLGEDHAALRARRVLTLMTREEAAALAADGVDVQLHTHRHRTPDDRALFLREIADNRSRVDAIRGAPATHFCYPSGIYKPSFLPWLRESGVRTATTCDPGLAGAGTEPLLLPRLVDTSFLSPLDVEGWLTGMSAFFMPRKASEHAARARERADA